MNWLEHVAVCKHPSSNGCSTITLHTYIDTWVNVVVHSIMQLCTASPASMQVQPVDCIEAGDVECINIH